VGQAQPQSTEQTAMPIQLLPCPFCGGAPVSFGRPATDGERNKQHRYMFFIACYCGGYSATAHKMGLGETPEEAEQNAGAKWNTRHNLIGPSCPSN
jgi:Lar family restriction alleviation protein